MSTATRFYLDVSLVFSWKSPLSTFGTCSSVSEGSLSGRGSPWHPNPHATTNRVNAIQRKVNMTNPLSEEPTRHSWSNDQCKRKKEQTLDRLLLTKIENKRRLIYLAASGVLVSVFAGVVALVSVPLLQPTNIADETTNNNANPSNLFMFPSKFKALKCSQ